MNSVDENTLDRPSVAVNTNTLVNSNILSEVENASDLIGQNFPNSSLANFKHRIFVAIVSCIARSIKICDNSHNRTENCTSKCIPIDFEKELLRALPLRTKFFHTSFLKTTNLTAIQEKVRRGEHRENYRPFIKNSRRT